MYDGKFLESRQGLDKEVIDHISDAFLHLLTKVNGQIPIQKLCQQADKQFGLEEGSCMFILKHQLANKHWHTDMMNQQIRISKPLIITGGIKK
ncbi:TnsA endonuclease C-terminal domain-containing protein [Paenibacillus alginolyticus]|nr:TnsA endonuclease C-terminal domain-containing protein [Paenibacillus alginolyticus]